MLLHRAKRAASITNVERFHLISSQTIAF